jgi:hypothetical protein
MGDTDDQLQNYMHGENSLKHTSIEMLTEIPDGTTEWVDVTEVKPLRVIDEHTNMLMNLMVDQQFQPITFRRICWPLPDRLCLLGRCGHCNDAPFRALGKIKHFMRHAPADWRPRLWDSYNSGKDNNFGDAQVWRGDWPKGVSRK